MADLNDFFAKKDKKNKKGGKKFSKANTDVLAKNLEEKDQKRAEDTTKNYALPNEAAESSASKASSEKPEEASEIAPRGNDDEWLSYDDEKKDYSNLKIASLTVDDPLEQEEHEINEEGEKVKKGAKATDKSWNMAAGKSNGGDSSPEVSRREEEEEKKSAAAAAAAPAPEAPSGGQKSSYVPPHMRGGGSAASSSPAPSMGPMSVNSRMANRRGNKAAPDINSEVFFPSLGGDDVKISKKGGRMDDFEEVRSGHGSQGHSRNSHGPGVALGNKFSALRD